MNYYSRRADIDGRYRSRKLIPSIIAPENLFNGSREIRCRRGKTKSRNHRNDLQSSVSLDKRWRAYTGED